MMLGSGGKVGQETKQKVRLGCDRRLVRRGGAATGGITEGSGRKKGGRRARQAGGDVPPLLKMGKHVKVKLKLFAGADIRARAGGGERLDAPGAPGWRD